MLRSVLGLTAGRSLWGLEPFDLGCCLGGGGKVSTHGDHYDDQPQPWYSRPTVRHGWGEVQHAAHAGAKDLFLDLVYVGAAYQLGTVVKYAFVVCDDQEVYACVGAGYGLL